MHTHLSKYLETNNILSENQSGYRKGRSTVSAISEMTDDILQNRNVGKNTIATFFDLKKAFDTVDHSILLEKLKLYSIKNRLLLWIKDYLSSRQQCTLANGIMSEPADIECGVPQGSILGPLLFLVYINDVDNICKNIKIMLFADDTVMYTSHGNDDTAVQLLQEDVNRFAGWCKRNKLTLNIDKTKFLGFGLKKCFKNAQIQINGSRISRVPNYKHLGVQLDPKISYEVFIKSQLRTVAYRTYQMNKISRFLGREDMLRLYKTYVLPILDYGDILYDKSAEFLLQKLQRAQNRAVKLCLGVNLREHTDKIHRDAGINLLGDRRKSHIYIEGFKRSRIDKYVCTRLYRTRAADGPVLKNFLPHCTAYQRSVHYNVSTCWNSLYPWKRNIQTMVAFRKKL